MIENVAFNNASQASDAAPRSAEPAVLRFGNGDSADASRNLLASLHDVHASSLQRNSKDTKTDTDAMQGDKDSVTLAGKTGDLADAVKAYIAKGGDFRDAKGQDLGKKFIGALRNERDDHSSDRQTDREYSGLPGLSIAKQTEATSESKAIAGDAAALANPNMSAEARNAALKSIVAGAGAIAEQMHDKTGKAGKDQNDAASESKVITADAQALLSGKLSPAQSKHLVDDMASKAGLIQRELADIPNEINYAQHDSAAIKAGANLEAVVRGAMHFHSEKSLHQLAGKLDQLHNASGEGVLDTVVKDRQADLALEPAYIAANNADNAQNNMAILQFTDPYKIKKS